jgi:hypothetical protein
MILFSHISSLIRVCSSIYLLIPPFKFCFIWLIYFILRWIKLQYLEGEDCYELQIKCIWKELLVACIKWILSMFSSLEGVITEHFMRTT